MRIRRRKRRRNKSSILTLRCGIESFITSSIISKTDNTDIKKTVSFAKRRLITNNKKMALYVKAFSLVLKTVSKPMAKSLKSFIVSQPELKKTCISLAQKINVMYSYIVLEAPIPRKPATTTVMDTKSGKPLEIVVTRGRSKSSSGASSSSHHQYVKPLSDDVALTNGAELVSEIFLFSVAGGLVYWEAEKSNEREREKKKIAAVERQQLTKLMELTKESLEDVVEELEELKRWRETVREKNYKRIYREERLMILIIIIGVAEPSRVATTRRLRRRRRKKPPRKERRMTFLTDSNFNSNFYY